MLFHRREDAEIALNAPVVVVTDVILNHINQFFLGGITFAVIAFPFQDAPEAFHRAVVDALSNAGHALYHTCLLQLVVKDPVGVLKSSVTMK